MGGKRVKLIFHATQQSFPISSAPFYLDVMMMNLYLYHALDANELVDNRAYRRSCTVSSTATTR